MVSFLGGFIRRPGMDHRALPPVRVIVCSYGLDWIVTIVLVGLFAGITNSVIPGFKREFSLTDTSIQHSFTLNERISFGQDIAIAGAFPLVSIIAIGLLFVGPWDVHHGVLGLILSCAMTTTVTEIVKVMVGRPRPDLIARCQPVADAANAAVYGLASYKNVCTVTEGHIIDDGFKSFPSGHTSFAFAGLGFFSLYLAGKLHLFDRRGRAIHAWVSLAPLLAALLVAISRTMDYRHHATDVLAGGILGSGIALLAYFLYYPMLTHPESHLPHMPINPSAPLASSSRAFAGQGPSGAQPGTNYPLEQSRGGGSPIRGYERVERSSVENSV